MTSHSRAPSLDEILAEEDFVRSLARSLLRDPNQAEDLVQHGLTESLARPAPRRLRSYLGRVVRNRAVDLHREETRRSAAEERAARQESAPSAAEIAERIELRERIAKAVMRLPEAQ
ncbi:MAG: RNA polymerase sigma factor, partial [Planctomycetota bacterium]